MSRYRTIITWWYSVRYKQKQFQVITLVLILDNIFIGLIVVFTSFLILQALNNYQQQIYF